MIPSKRTEAFQQRLILFGYFCGFVLFVLLLKLFYLQILRHPYFWRLARERTYDRRPLPAPRGRIFDRRGLLLAGDRPTFNLYVDPQYLRGKEDEVLRRLARLLGEDFSELKNEFLWKKKKAYGEVLLKKRLSRDTVARLEARRYFLPGIRVEPRPERYYPFGEAFFHVLGYVAPITQEEIRRLRPLGYGPSDYVGRTGLEKAYENLLRGRKGEREVERDAFGRVVHIVSETPPQPGADLFLTLEAAFQRQAYALLKDKSGAVVILDPSDGEVLSLVSAPALDPNHFVEGWSPQEWEKILKDPRHPQLNKALLSFHPGSTFKPVTLLAALEAHLVDPKEIIFCPGYYRLGRRVFRCWRRWGHGKVDIVRALAESCDTYFYVLGERLDIDYLADFARKCGFGKASGLGFPGEKPGIVPDRAWKRVRFGERWQKGETLNVAIGQGFLEVNLLQLTRFYAALANGGTLWQPWLVKEASGLEGGPLLQRGPRALGRLPVHPENLRWVIQGLTQAVEGKRGTGRAARVPGILVAGKTGTAQVVRKKTEKDRKDEEVPYEERDHAWFVAFAPVEKPEIVVGVFVEHGGHGGRAAAPIAGKLLRFYFKGERP
ncbi:penicillin-binding protein 2 [Thermosulfurimonas marina]|uniref:Penicillin-binding protein 2 n=1 Tax=Thermosulfurimonas marina TaxID=2047767 RepID=A0A6H1WSG5_9BACT|nr:penicillin-binding protein 2 [Thermosulfurimonas marina]QJA06099.1 penicillin-binding protein 2 [Thermosulfurimonas marina]